MRAWQLMRSVMKEALDKSGFELRRVPCRQGDFSAAQRALSQWRAPAKADDYVGRFREIVSDPVNLLIERHPMSGAVEQGYVMLHNGNIVPAVGSMRYYGAFSDILIINRGVHEPLEEYAFQEMLRRLPDAPVMLELGSYWSHYSMWMMRRKSEASVYMVEPDLHNLRVGQSNFELNKFDGVFIRDFVGDGHFQVDRFMSERGIAKFDVLHADVQGFEMQMLRGAGDALRNARVDYVFISTHSGQLHRSVEEFLNNAGYKVVVSSDFDTETTCYDGIIVATAPGIRLFDAEFSHLGRSKIAVSSPDALIHSLELARAR